MHSKARTPGSGAGAAAGADTEIRLGAHNQTHDVLQPEAAGSFDRRPCAVCGRKFAAVRVVRQCWHWVDMKRSPKLCASTIQRVEGAQDRLGKHQRICRKVKASERKRKVFVSASTPLWANGRVVGALLTHDTRHQSNACLKRPLPQALHVGMEAYEGDVATPHGCVCEVGVASRAPRRDSLSLVQVRQPPKRASKWRQQHLQLQSALKSMRGVHHEPQYSGPGPGGAASDAAGRLPRRSEI